jgi:endothelin-converting enzyme/putative endopeptidase
MRMLRILLLLVASSALLFSQSTPLRGVDSGDLNRAVEPCNDFYEFANGTWRANHPIPASMSRWSKRWAAGDATKDHLKVILEEAEQNQTAAQGSTGQLIGSYYAACTDEARVNARGVEPLKPWLAEIDSAKDAAGLQSVMMRLHDIAMAVPFGLASSQDPHEPTQVMADIFANGYSLPDRDYYLRPEPRFQETREKYVEHVANMFRLAGSDPAAAKAASATVFALETKLAEASLDQVSLRDPSATDHKTTLAALKTLAPHIGWDEYFKHAGLSPDVDLNVQQPKYMQEVDRQLQEAPLSDWKTYLKWNLLNLAADSLSAPFVEEDFAFMGKYLNGTSEMKPRWKRCVESTDRFLGEALGKKYVEKHFPPAAKARMQDLVGHLLSAMKDDILGLPWMSETTKKQALAKLATFNPKIGYPNQWKDYSKVNITRDSFWDNVVAGRRFAVQDDLSTIGKPVDRERWGLTTPTSDAYYNPLLNEIVFPAGILQPPAFSMDAVDAVNFGAIGVVIGHEISHGFDDQGAQYDEKGRLKNWWTETDLKKFQERGACVVDQFEKYFIEPGVHHNGKLVLGESIGDLGGAKIAYRAYKKSLEGKPRPADVDGFTPEQQFFIAWGQFRGDAIRIEQQRVMMQADPHPVAKYRVNGPLSNLPEFQKAFSCKADAPMVRPPEKRCEVW